MLHEIKLNETQSEKMFDWIDQSRLNELLQSSKFKQEFKLINQLML